MSYIGGCSACGEYGVYVQDYEVCFSKRSKQQLCFICASTDIGNMFAYPEQHIGQLSLARSIAQCTWIILRTIKGRDYRGEQS